MVALHESNMVRSGGLGPMVTHITLLCSGHTRHVMITLRSLLCSRRTPSCGGHTEMSTLGDI